MALKLGSSGLPLIGVEYIAKNIEKFRKDLDAGSRATDKANKELTRGQQIAAAFEKGITRASLAGTVAMTGLAAAGLKMASNFETAFAQVQTLFPGAEESIAHLKGGVEDLSLSLGVSAVGSTEALYDALSASVPPENALTFLETASKAAIGGAISTKEAVNVLTSTMNAFGIESSKAEEVSDILFTTVAKGKTTMGELARAMFNVAPAAAAAGLTLEETAAAIASITKQGVPTTVATTQLRQAIVELQKPGKDLKNALADIGFESGRAALEALGLQGTLSALEQSASANGKTLNQVFSSVEAAGAALALTGQNAQIAADDLAAMGDAAGTTAAAFETMNSTTARQFEIAKERIKTSAIVIMQDMLPAVNALLSGIAGLTSKFSSLDPETQKLIVAVGAMVIALPKLANAFGLSATKAGAFGVAIGGIAIAADLLLQKTTGAGLFEHILGDPAKTKRQAEAARLVGEALFIAGEAADPIGVLREELRKATSAMDKYESALDAVVSLGPKASNEWRIQEAIIPEIARAMREAGASAVELQDTYLSLDGAQREAFISATGLTQAAIDQAAAIERGREMGLDPWILRLNDAKESTEDTTAAVEDSFDAFEEWVNSLVDAETGAADLEAQIGATRDEIERLTSAMATQNPVVIGLKAENVLLEESINDLKNSGQELTQAQEDQIAAWEAQIELNSTIISGYADNEAAVRGLFESVGLLAGESGIRKLMQTFVDLETPQERQVAILGNISGIQLQLANNDVPAAIQSFENLKAVLSPAEWEAIGKAVGPELIAAIASSLEPGSPQVIDLLAAAGRIGGDIGAGVSQGLRDAGHDIEAAAISVVNDAFAELQRQIDARSPSRRAAREIGAPIAEGIAVGLRENGDSVEGAMAVLIKQALNVARTGELPSDAQQFGKELASKLGDGLKGGSIASALDSAITLAVKAADNPKHSAELRAIATTFAEAFSDAFNANVDLKTTAAPGIANLPSPEPPPPLPPPRTGPPGADGIIRFTATGQTFPAREQNGVIYYESPPGTWRAFPASQGHDQYGNPTGEVIANSPGFYNYTPLQRGTPMVPFDGLLAMLHAREAVLPAENNPFNPFATAPLGVSDRGGDTYEFTADLRGASFLGTPEQNARAIRAEFDRMMADQVGRDAFIHGAPIAR